MESAAKTPMVSGEWLGALAVRVRLNRTEWRVLAIVISSPNPVSASSVARRLRLDYGLVKRVVRELVLWNILERTPRLTFQPDHTRWGPPRPRVNDLKTQPGVSRDSDRGQSGHDHLRPHDSLNSNSA
jgi:hypothetical protein